MGQVVTVEGSWEICDAIAPKVAWHKMKCVIPVIKETLYYTITSKKNLGLAYFCEKVTLSKNCNN